MTYYDNLYLNIKEYISIAEESKEIIAKGSQLLTNLDSKRGLCYGLVSMWGSMYLRKHEIFFQKYINILTEKKLSKEDLKLQLSYESIGSNDSPTLAEFIKNMLINHFHNDISFIDYENAEENQRRTIALNKVRVKDKQKEQPPITKIGGCYLHDPIFKLQEKIETHKVDGDVDDIRMFFSLAGNNHTIGARFDNKQGILLFDPNFLSTETNKPLILEETLKNSKSFDAIRTACDEINYMKFTDLRLYTLKAYADGHFVHKGGLDFKKITLIYQNFKYLKSLIHANQNLNIKKLEDKLDKIIEENSDDAIKIYYTISDEVNKSYDEGSDKYFRSYITELYSILPIQYMTQSFTEYYEFAKHIKTQDSKTFALHKLALSNATDCISGNNLLYTHPDYVGSHVNEYKHVASTMPHSLLLYFNTNSLSKFTQTSQLPRNEPVLLIIMKNLVYQMQLLIDVYGFEKTLLTEAYTIKSNTKTVLDFCVEQKLEILIFLFQNYNQQMLALLKVANIKEFIHKNNIKDEYNQNGYNLYKDLLNLKEYNSRNDFHNYLQDKAVQEYLESTHAAIKLANDMVNKYKEDAKKTFFSDSSEQLKIKAWKYLKFHLIFGKSKTSAKYIREQLQPISSPNGSSMKELYIFSTKYNIVGKNTNITNKNGVFRLLSDFLIHFGIIDFLDGFETVDD